MSPTDTAETVTDGLVTFKTAAEMLGVSVDTLKRRQKSGELPEAIKVNDGRAGVWHLPESAVAVAGAKFGWTIDLRADDGPVAVADTPAVARADSQVAPAELTELVDRLAAAEKRAGASEGQLGAVQTELEQMTRRFERSSSDLEAERAEAARVREDLANAEKRAAVADNVLVEVRGQLEREQALADAVAAERDVLRQQLADAERSMGWWSRRRWGNRQSAS